MKILVTGSNGLVGNAIHKLLTNSDHEHINTSWSLGGIASHVIDITDNESIEKVVEEFRPDAIINSAAMANVDNCEVERDKCWKVNVEGVKNLVNTCDNYEINIDNGLYFGNKNLYIENQNIFVSGILNDREENIKWELKKI